MLSRRFVMGGAASTILLAACGGSEDAKKIMTENVTFKRKAGQPEVGIQTYTIRNAMEADTVAALRMLKEVGYDYIESNDRDFTRIPMAEFKAAVDEVGLKVPATHIGFETVYKTPEKAAEMAKTLGCKYGILSWTPEAYRSTKGYSEVAARFNEIGEVMLKDNIRYAYHNHHFEFWEIDGPRNGMEIYLEETDPEKVWFELDLFWTVLGRNDPPALFKKYPGRFKLCHIKDMNTAALADFEEGNLDFDTIHKGLMVNVGKGDLPFEKWLQMSDVSGIEYLITEHDAPPDPLRASVAQSLKTVRGYNL